MFKIEYFRYVTSSKLNIKWFFKPKFLQSNLAPVRSAAQSLLHSFSIVFLCSHEVLLPRLTELFTSPEVEHDTFKGALYVVKPYLAVHSWDAIQ